MWPEGESRKERVWEAGALCPQCPLGELAEITLQEIIWVNQLPIAVHILLKGHKPPVGISRAPTLPLPGLPGP